LSSVLIVRGKGMSTF